MNIKNTKAFTLVELLVVITILAIISVVAYQNFGGAVDKANSGRKISDVSTIESSLQQYKVDKNYYPAVGVHSVTNLWGYDSTATSAQSSNQIITTKDPGSEEIKTITTASIGGGIVYNGKGTAQQIGAKGTISQKELTKTYLTKDLYDPEIGDVKVKDIGGGTSGKMIDLGVGRYIYSVYKKPTGTTWSTNKTGTYYNIAYTIKKDGTDSYITKVVGDYDEESCFADSATCPKTLIGTWNDYLNDKQEIGTDYNGTALGNFGADQPKQGIPYPVDGY